MKPTQPANLLQSLKTVALCATAPLAGVILWLNFSSTATGQDAPPEPVAEEEVLVPQPPNFSAYADKFSSKSPFDFPLAPPPVAETVDAFKDWALAGMSRIGNNTMVTIQNLKVPQERKYLWSDQRHNQGGNGIVFVEVKGSRTREAELIIEKDNQRSTLKWDERVLAMVAGAGAGGPQTRTGQPPQPGQPNVPQPPGGGNQAGTNALLQRLQQQNQQAATAAAQALAQQRAEAARRQMVTAQQAQGQNPQVIDPLAAQNGQPAVTVQQPANVSNSEQLLRQLQEASGNNTQPTAQPNTGRPNFTPPQVPTTDSSKPRRRVVLPTPPTPQ